MIQLTLKVATFLAGAALLAFALRTPGEQIGLALISGVLMGTPIGISIAQRVAP